MSKIIVCVCFILSILVVLSSQHSYKLGKCPVIQPTSNFRLNDMLGIWYVIKQTKTSSSCITLNITETRDPFIYNIEQANSIPLVPGKRQISFTGTLKAVDPKSQANMTIKWDKGIGKASYIVFEDGKDYLATFSCQQAGSLGHRQSVSILSRSNHMSDTDLRAIQNTMTAENINPFDLSIISQSNCPDPFDTVLTIGDVGDAVRLAGDKLGDGVEYVAENAEKLYNKHIRKDTYKEEVSASGSKLTSHNPDAEWIP